MLDVARHRLLRACSPSVTWEERQILVGPLPLPSFREFAPEEGPLVPGRVRRAGGRRRAAEGAPMFPRGARGLHVGLRRRQVKPHAGPPCRVKGELQGAGQRSAQLDLAGQKPRAHDDGVSRAQWPSGHPRLRRKREAIQLAKWQRPGLNRPTQTPLARADGIRHRLLARGAPHRALAS